MTVDPISFPLLHSRFSRKRLLPFYVACWLVAHALMPLSSMAARQYGDRSPLVYTLFALRLGIEGVGQGAFICGDLANVSSGAF